jgi:hypothetical protein
MNATPDKNMSSFIFLAQNPHPQSKTANDMIMPAAKKNHAEWMTASEIERKNRLMIDKKHTKLSHGKLNTWKRRLGAFSENMFTFICLTNGFSEFPRYATKMDAH